MKRKREEKGAELPIFLFIYCYFNMQFEAEKYEKISEEKRLLEFSQPNVKIMNALIFDGQSLQLTNVGQAGKIQPGRKDPTIIIGPDGELQLYQQVYRVLIVNSSKGSKKNIHREGAEIGDNQGVPEEE